MDMDTTEEEWGEDEVEAKDSSRNSRPKIRESMHSMDGIHR